MMFFFQRGLQFILFFFFFFWSFSSMDVQFWVTFFYFKHINHIHWSVVWTQQLAGAIGTLKTVVAVCLQKTGAKKKKTLCNILLDCLNHRLLKSLLLRFLWCGRLINEWHSGYDKYWPPQNAPVFDEGLVHKGPTVLGKKRICFYLQSHWRIWEKRDDLCVEEGIFLHFIYVLNQFLNT